MCVPFPLSWAFDFEFILTKERKRLSPFILLKEYHPQRSYTPFHFVYSPTPWVSYGPQWEIIFRLYQQVRTGANLLTNHFFSGCKRSPKDWSGTSLDQSWPHILVKSSFGHPLILTSRSRVWDLTGRTIENPALHCRISAYKIWLNMFWISQTCKMPVLFL